MTVIGKYEARNELLRIVESREPISQERLRELGRAAEVVGIDTGATYKDAKLVILSKVQFAALLLFGKPDE